MSIEYIQKKANEGDVEYISKLAKCYYLGEGLEQNYEEAAKLFNKAANMDLAEAKTYYAYMCLNGLGVEKDEKKAVNLYKEAADYGDGVACYSYGIILKKGLYGVEQNLDKAKSMFDVGVKLDNYAAKYEMALILEKDAQRYLESSDTISQQKGESLLKTVEEYLEEAAQKGHLRAKYALGVRYLKVKEKEKNQKALKLFEECAENDIVAANYAIGYIYDCGLGVAKDYWKSFEYFKRAYDGGYKKAMLNMAYAYITGLGVKRDFEKAIDLCRQAVNSGIIEGNYFAGLCFEHGLGVAQNLDKATELYSYAADVDYIPALYRMGRMYDEQYSEDFDNDVAIEYYERAAKLGSYNAIAELARINMDKESKKSLEKLKLAADSDSYVGCLYLAKEYELGKNIKQDLIKALEYYKKSADLGSILAVENVLRIAEKNKDAALKKQYRDKLLVKEDSGVYIDVARKYGEARDYERAAYWYAMVVAYAEDEEDVEKAKTALNKFAKGANGIWTAKV